MRDREPVWQTPADEDDSEDYEDWVHSDELLRRELERHEDQWVQAVLL